MARGAVLAASAGVFCYILTMTRARSVVALLVSCAAVTSCTEPPGVQDPHALAIEACSVLDQNFRQEFDADVLDFIAGRYASAADTAAKAASIDSEYADLVRDLTALEGFFAQLASTVRMHGEDPGAWPADAAERLVSLGEEVDASETDLKALCRIERAG